MAMQVSKERLLNLKSNMDRFIVNYYCRKTQRIKNLKSNMDRFIGTYARAVKVFYRI